MHYPFIHKALELAKQRKGFCAPNPAVGAVIAKGTELLSSGFHWGPSHPHAEVEALKHLSSDLTKQADLYVTLEPCCHHGKTPPCTEAIIRSGIARVFYAYKDPDIRVSGKGIAILESAGVLCQQIDLPEINHFYASYQYWQLHQKPKVIAKLAMSLDGKIAGPEGVPLKISGAEADAFTHQQRKHADAVLTTARTIQTDDPRLDARLSTGIFKKNLYILDKTLSIPLTARVFQTAAEIILLHAEGVHSRKIRQYEALGAICMPISCYDNGQLHWEDIFKEMGKNSIQEVWVEAGARCFESLIVNNQLHEAYLYFSSKFIGFTGIPAFSTPENLLKKVEKSEWRILGEDAVCRLSFASDCKRSHG